MDNEAYEDGKCEALEAVRVIYYTLWTLNMYMQTGEAIPELWKERTKLTVEAAKGLFEGLHA